MTPKVFRLGKFRRWYVLVVSVLGCGALIWLAVKGAQLASKNELFSILLIPFGVIALFTAFLCGYMTLAIWSYRIEFGENGLTVIRYGLPFARPFRCSYEDIAYVRRPIMKGSIEVTPKDGKPFQFLIIVEGGSDAVMDEFERHLGAEKFQMFLREELKRYSKFDKAIIALVAPIVIVAILFFVPKFIARFVAWETIWPPSTFNFGDVKSFWFDESGSIWLGNRQPLSSKSEIIQVTGRDSNYWTIDLTSFDLVLADSANQPWVVDYDGLFHWTGSSWTQVPLDGYTIASYSAPPVVINGTYWVGAYSESKDMHFLISVDLDTEEIKTFELPPDLALNNFMIRELRLAPDGSLLVMVTKPFYPVFFYSYQTETGIWDNKMELTEAKWETQTAFGYDRDPWLEFGGFAMDKDEHVWVVLDDQTGSKIGMYDESIRSWKWSVIEEDCDLCSSSYSDIIIDDYGRAWVKADYGRKSSPDSQYGILQGRGVDVLLVHWGQPAERIMRYTRDNSNYQLGFGSSDLQITNDGQIWTAGNRLVRIDATKSELPAPLPDWFANLITVETYFKIIYATLFLAFLLAIIYLVWSKLLKR